MDNKLKFLTSFQMILLIFLTPKLSYSMEDIKYSVINREKKFINERQYIWEKENGIQTAEGILKHMETIIQTIDRAP